MEIAFEIPETTVKDKSRLEHRRNAQHSYASATELLEQVSSCWQENGHLPDRAVLKRLRHEMEQLAVEYEMYTGLRKQVAGVDDELDMEFLTDEMTEALVKQLDDLRLDASEGVTVTLTEKRLLRESLEQAERVKTLRAELRECLDTGMVTTEDGERSSMPDIHYRIIDACMRGLVCKKINCLLEEALQPMSKKACDEYVKEQMKDVIRSVKQRLSREVVDAFLANLGSPAELYKVIRNRRFTNSELTPLLGICSLQSQLEEKSRALSLQDALPNVFGTKRSPRGGRPQCSFLDTFDHEILRQAFKEVYAQRDDVDIELRLKNAGREQKGATYRYVLAFFSVLAGGLEALSGCFPAIGRFLSDCFQGITCRHETLRYRWSTLKNELARYKDIAEEWKALLRFVEGALAGYGIARAKA